MEYAWLEEQSQQRPRGHWGMLFASSETGSHYVFLGDLELCTWSWPQSPRDVTAGVKGNCRHTWLIDMFFIIFT